jgi:membrane fusion protein (multidrug efflux system)
MAPYVDRSENPVKTTKEVSNGFTHAEAGPTDELDVPVPPKRRPWLRYGLIALVFVAALGWGLKWYLHGLNRVFTDDAYVDTDQVMVMTRVPERVAAVLPRQNERVRRGQVVVILEDSAERARLAAAQGALAAALASENSMRTSASLEGETQRAQVDTQAGMLEAARRANEESRSRIRSAANAVSVAQAELESALTAVRIADAALPAAAAASSNADAEMRRDGALAAQGYVSSSTLDAARTAVSQAHAAYEAAAAKAQAARMDVRVARARLAQAKTDASTAQAVAGSVQAQIPVAQARVAEQAAASRVPSKIALTEVSSAQVKSARAQVLLAKVDLDGTRIVSPIDGWIAVRNVEPGQTVVAGQALLTISPVGGVFVTANYKETQLDRIRPGLDVEIAVDACHGRTFVGKVVGLAPVAQSALSTLPTLTAPSNFVKVAQRVPVRISLPAAGDGCVFRPGMSVETSVLTKRG